MILIQLTGLSGAGKSTIAVKVKTLLEKEALPVKIIDGDEYRKTLCNDLGFSKEDRHENIRRLGLLAADFVENGSIAIIAAISPYEQIRQELKDKYGALTVWINCDLDELVRRDTKGLYKRALLPDGDPLKVGNLTGVNDVFEEPKSADLVLDTHKEDADECTLRLLAFIRRNLPAK